VKKFYFLFLFRGVVMVGGMGEKKMGGVFIMHQTHLDVTHGRLKERERGGANGAQDMGRERKRNAPPSSPPPPAMADLIFMMREKETSFFLFPFFIPPLSLGPTFFSYSTPTSSALPAVIVPSHFFSSLPPTSFSTLCLGWAAGPRIRTWAQGGGKCNKSIFFIF
jgi:hypothetical protein